VGVHWQTSTGRFHSSHTVPTRIRIDDAMSIPFCCKLIARIRTQIDLLCGIILKAALSWTLTQCGVQGRFRITLQVCELIFSDGCELPHCQHHTETNGIRYRLPDLAGPFLMNADTLSSMGTTKRSSGLVRRPFTAPRITSSLGHYGNHRNES
jgi:hypothetical protein